MGKTMDKKTVRQIIFPLTAAMIWGSAFVGQSVVAEALPPITFIAIRAVIGFFFLLGLCRVLEGIEKRRTGTLAPKGSRRDLIRGGLACGLFLTAATNFQQAGLSDTPAGKAGFITALYMVLVPIFGIFLKRPATRRVWVSALIALVGLYFLCITGDFSLQRSDLLVLVCAFLFAGQIMAIDHFVTKVDGVRLSCAQFLVVAVASGVLALLFETPLFGLADAERCFRFAALYTKESGVAWGVVLPILYVGTFSSGIAYTLQILAQKDSDPTVVSLLLSTESVFSVIFGALLLHDRLSGREYLVCSLMLGAGGLSQLPET